MQQQMTEAIVGRVVFRNQDNAYTVAQMFPDHGGVFTAVGTLPEVYQDMRLRLEGQWTTHARYGQQFKVKTYEIVPPDTEDGIETYLGSGLIEEVGPVTARLIVEAFGDDTLRVLDEEPERLKEIAGIGPKRASAIAESWRAHRRISKLMMFLTGHGVSTGLSLKIHRVYGPEALAVVLMNPYRLTEIHGVGFQKADQVARAMGFARDDAQRVQAGVLHVLQEQVSDGHVYTLKVELLDLAVRLLGVAKELVEEAIDVLATANHQREHVYVEDVAGERVVYPMPYHDAETRLAERVRLLMTSGSSLKPVEDWESLLSRAARGVSVELSPEQRQAVQVAVANKVAVLTGGPGTGKTTVTQAVIGALEALGCTYALCAPTGRAAKRLSEITGRPAQTIHRLLRFSPEKENFSHHELDPLPADFVVVDEASMLDLKLADRLLGAVDLPAHVLFVGDVDQLPSVGAGNVLRDLIASGRIPVAHLTEVFRQAADSGIIVNAHRINQGDSPICNDGFGDFFLFSADGPEDAAERVVDVVANRIPRKFGISPDDIQVLAPMYRGPCGVDALNERLQEALNPPSPRKAEKKVGQRVLRVGDRVMQTVNDYDKDVFNGDVGQIVGIDPKGKKVVVQMDGRWLLYDWREATEQLVHANAISIHKSQGGEYPAIVIPVLRQHYVMLQRNLLYTAITRARRLVVLVGSRQAIAIAVKNAKVQDRRSGLAMRLASKL